jgi:hypothetical protein
MKDDFKNHIYEFKIMSDVGCSIGSDHYDIFRCIKCGYWLYRKYPPNPIRYYWIIGGLFWDINFDNSNILSCEENIIKNLLE